MFEEVSRERTWREELRDVSTLFWRFSIGGLVVFGTVFGVLDVLPASPLTLSAAARVAIRVLETVLMIVLMVLAGLFGMSNALRDTERRMKALWRMCAWAVLTVLVAWL